MRSLVRSASSAVEVGLTHWSSTTRSGFPFSAGGRLRLGVGRLFPAVEDIVRAEMDQYETELAGQPGQVPDGDGVDPEGHLGIVLTFVYPMESGGVDYGRGLQVLEDAAHSLRTGDIELGGIKREYLISGQGFHQIGTQLSVGADDGDSHGSPCGTQAGQRARNRHRAPL